MFNFVEFYYWKDELLDLIGNILYYISPAVLLLPTLKKDLGRVPKIVLSILCVLAILHLLGFWGMEILYEH